MLLELEGIIKEFPGVRALRDVGLTLRGGTVLGLIGQNGAGKSTLMNVLGGVVQPDQATMRLAGGVYAPRKPADAIKAGIAFIHQELNLFTNLSIADNLFIGGFPRLGRTPFIDRRQTADRARALMRAVDLDLAPDTRVEKLSPGERQLVEIARALSIDARVIIFDEPTTSLTARETERLFALIRRLRSEGKAIIYISHILADVMALADEIVVMRDGEVVGSGPVAGFSVNRMISLMVGRAIEQLYPARTSRPGEEVVLEVRSLSQPGLVRDVSFVLRRGEVLGLFGLMGSGRTELARILFGLDEFAAGEILLEGTRRERHTPRENIRRGMAFVTENRRDEGLLVEATVAENVALVSLPTFARPGTGAVDRTKMMDAVRRIVGSLGIQSGAPERQPVRHLSGGNQQKVVIGKWLLAQPSLFILDEPTRGIDVGAKFEVYSIINDLAARGTGVLVISSELEELTGICDRILVMGNGMIRGTFERRDFEQEPILRAAFNEEVAT
jgi:ribose transport system ATP-binding protein